MGATPTTAPTNVAFRACATIWGVVLGVAAGTAADMDVPFEGASCRAPSWAAEIAYSRVRSRCHSPSSSQRARGQSNVVSTSSADVSSPSSGSGSTRRRAAAEV